MGSTDKLTMLVTRTGLGLSRCELTLETPGRALTADFVVVMPGVDADLADVRWLIEDYPKLRSSAADAMAVLASSRSRDVGRSLGSALFGSREASAIRTALADSALVAGLHVRINDTAFPGWTPWELLLEPEQEQPLSLRVASFVRLAGQATTDTGTTRVTERLRLLLVIARPSGEEDVPFRSVATCIMNAAASTPVLQVSVLRPPTFSSLEVTLRRAVSAGQPYDAVHFDGHGSYRASIFSHGAKRGYLRFEGETGGADERTGREVGNLLADCGVRFLLLNACRSGYGERVPGDASGQPTTNAFGSVATDVLDAGVQNVLAMSYNIYVANASRLITDTYAALAAGRSIGESVSYARRREAGRGSSPSDLAWAVPVVYGFEDNPILGSSSEVPALDIGVSTATPANAWVVDPAGGDGPRSAKRPFVGYDHVFLYLERAFRNHTYVEIAGLAGVGKSAMVGEFARWATATKLVRSAVIVDMRECSSYTALKRMIKDRVRMSTQDCQVQPTPGKNVLWIFEDIDGAFSENSDARWDEKNRRELLRLLNLLGEGQARVLLTGRSPIDLPNLDIILLDGLDAEERKSLAAVAGLNSEAFPAAAALLEWTQGLPAVVLQLPTIVAAINSATINDVHELLDELRMGSVGSDRLGAQLLGSSRISTYDVRLTTAPALPIALGLFQGFISAFDWQLFCGLLDLKGLHIGGDAPLDTLARELRPAASAGLASLRADGAYMIHPLAPLALRDGFDITVAALSGRDSEARAQLFKLLWLVYSQAITVSQRTRSFLGNLERSVGPRLLERQNLWHAMELLLSGAVWGLALPAMQVLRDDLLAEQRPEEWSAFLQRALAALHAFPPEEQDMGPESAPLHITRILALEAERQGDHALASRLYAIAARISFSEHAAMEPAGEPDTDSSHATAYRISTNRRYSALVQKGDEAAYDGSPTCLGFYLEACDMAHSMSDKLRLVDVQLAIAQAYFNVPEMRNLSKCEEYARAALSSLSEFGFMEDSLVFQCKLSIGTAIVEQLRDGAPLDRRRVDEARASLFLASSAGANNPNIRASALNNLGLLMQVTGTAEQAADYYLRACAEWESVGLWEEVVTAETNAAGALVDAGKGAEAKNVARIAQDMLTLAPRMSARLAPILEDIVNAGDA